MTTTIYKNANIYSHHQHDFIQDAWFEVEDETGKITQVGKGTPNKIADQIVDVHHQFIMPGIMNAHTHITSVPREFADRVDERHGTTPEVATMYAIHNMRDLINNGVTYIRNVGAQFDVDIAVEQMRKSGFIEGPRIKTSGQAISMTGGHGSDGGYEVDGVDEMRKTVRTAMKNGAKNIKMMVTGGVLKNGETPDDIQLTFDEVRAGVIEAHHKGYTVAAHAQGNVGIKEAVEAGVDTIEHGFDIDDETIKMMKQHGTAVVPTLNAMYGIYEFGEGTVPDWARQKVIVNIEKHFKSIEKAAKAGIPIAMGTDAGTPYNGFTTESAYEIQLEVEKAHMTPAQAIESATIICAEVMQVGSEYGSIEAGKFADFIVMAENPIDDISVIQRDKDVYQHGKRVHAANVQTIEARQAEPIAEAGR